MKENDIKIKWEWSPGGVRMALQWRDASPAPDSFDIFSPEEAPGRRLTSSATRHSFHYQACTLLGGHKVTVDLTAAVLTSLSFSVGNLQLEVRIKIYIYSSELFDSPLAQCCWSQWWSRAMQPWFKNCGSLTEAHFQEITDLLVLLNQAQTWNNLLSCPNSRISC